MLRNKTIYVPVVQGQITTLEVELPKEVDTIIGFSISGDREDLVYARASVEARIAGIDLIKSGERSTKYMYGIDNPSRMFNFGELALRNEDRRLLLRVQDQDSPIAIFSAYNLEFIIHYRAVS